MNHLTDDAASRLLAAVYADPDELALAECEQELARVDQLTAHAVEHQRDFLSCMDATAKHLDAAITALLDAYGKGLGLRVGWDDEVATRAEFALCNIQATIACLTVPTDDSEDPAAALEATLEVEQIVLGPNPDPVDVLRLAKAELEAYQPVAK